MAKLPFAERARRIEAEINTLYEDIEKQYGQGTKPHDIFVALGALGEAQGRTGAAVYWLQLEALAKEKDEKPC